MANKQNKPPIAKPAAPARPAPAAAATPSAFTPVLRLSLLLGAIAFILYAGTLGHGFVLDDFSVIKNNAIVTKGSSAIFEILHTPYRRGWFITTNDLYRPLSLVMFAIEYQLGNGGPWLHHFMNVLIYAFSVIFLFRFIDKLFAGKLMGVAFVAALLFAVHPIHTEVVANIKSRDELLCFCLSFLSLNMLLTYMDKGRMRDLLLGILCYFLALLSKETVITFIFLVPFIFFLYRNEDRKRAIIITSTVVGTAVLFLVIRMSVLHHYGADQAFYVEFIDNILIKMPLGGRLATAMFILGKYLLLLVVPNPLICDYSYNSIPATTFGNIWVIASVLVYVGMAVVAVLRLLRNRKDPYAFGIVFFLVTLSLFANIVFVIGAAMAERFLFFASVGFCLVVALLLQQFLAGAAGGGAAMLKNSKVLAVAVGISVVFAWLSNTRNADWLDNYTLFKADIVKAPEDSRLNFYYGTEISVTVAEAEGNPARRRELMDEAVMHLKKALAIYPDYNSAHSAIGNAYFHMGMYDSAEVHGKRAIQLSAKDIVSMNNLAGVYFIRKDYAKSIELCNRVLALNPKYVNTLSNKGLAFMNLGRYDSALASLRKAIDADPNFTGTYKNLALTFRAMGNADSARYYDNLAARPRGE